MDAQDDKRRREYEEYINSAAWRRLRDYAIKQAGGKCARCGVSRWSVRLEVHHLTYERFKRERLEDVIVLCPKCHEAADEERRAEMQRKNALALEAARFEGFARKVYGDEWRDAEDFDAIRERYYDWREQS